MSTIAVPTAGAIGERSGIWPLARLEGMRYARHPLFLVGLLLGVLASAGEREPIELDYQVIPAFFIGVFGVVVAARLTTSTDRFGPVVDAAPMSQTNGPPRCAWPARSLTPSDRPGKRSPSNRRTRWS